MCSPGGTFEPESADNSVDESGEAALPLGKGIGGESDIAEVGAEGRVLGADASAPDEKETAVGQAVGQSRAKLRTREAFQLAWKEKFKGKGTDMSIPSKEEAHVKFGRYIETDQRALRDIRARMSMLAARLELAVAAECYAEAAALRDELKVQRLRDPLQIRQHLWAEMQAAGKAGDLDRAASLRLSVQEVERYLPQFQLGGDWEGIYASHGKETVRVHYEGSTLIAVKIIGDANVPKGEITFTADLSPAGLLGPIGGDAVSHPAEKIRMVLEGHLENVVAIQGRGQVAKAGFQSPTFIDGQLLLFEEGVLGFIFLPMASMIVFERVFEETDKATAGDNETQKAHNIADSNIGNTDNDNNNNTNTARPRDGF